MAPSNADRDILPWLRRLQPAQVGSLVKQNPKSIQLTCITTKPGAPVRQWIPPPESKWVLVGHGIPIYVVTKVKYNHDDQESCRQSCKILLHLASRYHNPHHSLSCWIHPWICHLYMDYCSVYLIQNGPNNVAADGFI